MKYHEFPVARGHPHTGAAGSGFLINWFRHYIFRLVQKASAERFVAPVALWFGSLRPCWPSIGRYMAVYSRDHRSCVAKRIPNYQVLNMATSDTCVEFRILLEYPV